MSREVSGLVRELPLASLLGPSDDGIARLRFEVIKAAHEFGFYQMTVPANWYGQPRVIVRLELRQPWEPAPREVAP